MRRHFSEVADNCCPNIEILPRRGHIEKHFDYVYLQTWTSGSRRRYWIIERNGNLLRPVDGEEIQNHLRAVHEREQKQGQDEESRALQPTSVPPQLSYAEQWPWIERTGWDQTYSDKGRRKVLAALITMDSCPSGQAYLLARQGISGLTEGLVSSTEDEMKIAALVKLVDPMLDRREETARETGRSILCWLRSTRALSTYLKPFTLVRHPSLMKKYRLLFKKFLCMVFGLYRMSSSAHLKTNRGDTNDGVGEQGANESAEEDDGDESEEDETEGEDEASDDGNQGNDDSWGNVPKEAPIDNSHETASEDSDDETFADETECNGEDAAAFLHGIHRQTEGAFENDRQAILDRLRGRSDISKDNNLGRSQSRVRQLGDQLERWRIVGCQLCYASDEPDLDHDLENCTRADSARARQLLAWLESLRLDRFGPIYGFCSLCHEADELCREWVTMCRIRSASTEESKTHWKEVFSSATGPDSLCNNKQAVRRTIAALCAFDNQILAEGRAAEWFERRIPLGET
ncbi:telomere-associated helicase [Fusarium mundagurra]|uniref:Telomere-associated helicase n=1 Tax=Fusarium mundagurra TaxID=1567541 RepID=A0A8H5XX30_9HYPO|nr:telomere-associated helicase [Fusarium mundagurra]